MKNRIIGSVIMQNIQINNRKDFRDGQERERGEGGWRSNVEEGSHGVRGGCVLWFFFSAKVDRKWSP